MKLCDRDEALTQSWRQVAIVSPGKIYRNIVSHFAWWPWLLWTWEDFQVSDIMLLLAPYASRIWELLPLLPTLLPEENSALYSCLNGPPPKSSIHRVGMHWIIVSGTQSKWTGKCPRSDRTFYPLYPGLSNKRPTSINSGQGASGEVHHSLRVGPTNPLWSSKDLES